MTLSTHKCEVVPVTLEKHPNAESLSVCRVHGYTVCVRTEDWQGIELAVYLPPDSVVDTDKPEFLWLKSGDCRFVRVKAKKLRGIMSFGCMIKAPEGTKVGDDIAELLGVTHYEPAECATTGGDNVSTPPELAHLTKYDIDALRRYPGLFLPGENVFVTEKIHGCNSRFAYVNGQTYCGSRTGWKKDDARSVWWRALRNTPELERFCKAHPEYVAYGEVYGDVKNFYYGRAPGNTAFVGFDIYDLTDNRWLNAENSRDIYMAEKVPVVPFLGIIPFDFGRVCALAEGKTQMPGATNTREGCVVKPLTEALCDEVGRVQLKIVGGGFLEKG